MSNEVAVLSAARRKVYTGPWEERCRVNMTANVLTKLLKSLRANR